MQNLEFFYVRVNPIREERTAMEPNKRSKNNYIDGNTVRNYETAPKRREKPEERIDKRSAQTKRQREKQKQINQRIAKRNREKASRLSLGYTLFLGFAVVVTLLSCIHYLDINNELTQKSNEITILKEELNTITDANTAAAKRVSNAIDLEAILTQAKELGMDYPDSGQIVYFEKAMNEDYVRQYQSIPK